MNEYIQITATNNKSFTIGYSIDITSESGYNWWTIDVYDAVTSTKIDALSFNQDDVPDGFKLTGSKTETAASYGSYFVRSWKGGENVPTIQVGSDVPFLLYEDDYVLNITVNEKIVSLTWRFYNPNGLWWNVDLCDQSQAKIKEIFNRNNSISGTGDDQGYDLSPGQQPGETPFILDLSDLEDGCYIFGLWYDGDGGEYRRSWSFSLGESASYYIHARYFYNNEPLPFAARSWGPYAELTYVYSGSCIGIEEGYISDQLVLIRITDLEGNEFSPSSPQFMGEDQVLNYYFTDLEISSNVGAATIALGVAAPEEYEIANNGDLEYYWIISGEFKTDRSNIGNNTNNEPNYSYSTRQMGNRNIIVKNLKPESNVRISLYINNYRFWQDAWGNWQDYDFIVGTYNLGTIKTLKETAQGYVWINVSNGTGNSWQKAIPFINVSNGTGNSWQKA